MPIEVTPAVEADLIELADVAARTFPLACPPSTTPEDVAAFLAENLSTARFLEYVTDPDRTVLTARADGAAPPSRILGYAILVRGVVNDADVQRAVTLRPAAELSKLYVLPEAHGIGVAAALMATALEHARALGSRCVWLGVNQENQRAQRFYEKQGFGFGGTKTFRLGGRLENDFVMVRPL